MTRPDDDDYVSAPQSLDDMVAMALARQALRPLVPDAAPRPSAALTTMLTEGVPPVAASRRSRLIGRLAGVGLAGKLMLAAGVAVAGGTATVALTHNSPPAEHGDLPAHTPSTQPPTTHPAAVVPTATDATHGDAPEAEHSSAPTPARTDDRHETSPGGTGTDDTSHRDSSRGGSDDSTERETRTPSPSPTATSSPEQQSGDSGSSSDGGTSSDSSGSSGSSSGGGSDDGVSSSDGTSGDN